MATLAGLIRVADTPGPPDPTMAEVKKVMLRMGCIRGVDLRTCPRVAGVYNGISKGPYLIINCP